MKRGAETPIIVGMSVCHVCKSVSLWRDKGSRDLINVIGSEEVQVMIGKIKQAANDNTITKAVGKSCHVDERQVAPIRAEEVDREKVNEFVRLQHQREHAEYELEKKEEIRQTC